MIALDASSWLCALCARRARIAELIDEATVDCYSDQKQHEGFVVMLEEHLAARCKPLS